MEIAVPQVVADRELMFSHLCQHGPNGVPKRMPAHADDANLGKRRFDLLPEHGGKVQRLLAAVAKGRENEIPRSVVAALRLPFQQRIFQR